MALREIAVVGVHATEQAWKLQGRQPFDLTIEALDGALADAGLQRSDLDGVALDWFGPGGVPGEASSWARVLGHDVAWTSDGYLDTSGVRGVLKGAAAIAAGLCEVVALGGAGVGSRSIGVPVTPPRSEFTDVWGAYVLPLFGLVAARHMYEFGTRPEHLAAVAASIRNLGYSNPEAVMFGRAPISIEDVLESRMVSSPFHLLDCCIAAEGGAVLILTSVERARDLQQPVVAILGGAMQASFGPYSNPALYRDIKMLGVTAAKRALALAGRQISDMDVLSLYDANSFEVIRQLEILGVCSEGEGGPYVDEVGIGIESPLPVNTDGGCLSYAWNGTQQQTLKVIEIVRQLRGTAVHQVDDAQTGLATNAGTGAGHLEVAVLGKL